VLSPEQIGVLMVDLVTAQSSPQQIRIDTVASISTTQHHH
jgi:hypothetical protein